MPVENRPEPYPVGTLVKILNSQWPRARIVEIRGNLGVGGARIYRLMLRRKPSPTYIELPESRIELFPEEAPVAGDVAREN